MIRKITQFKNAAKLGFGAIKSIALGKRIPLIVSLHVTNRCNLRCPYCYANYENRFASPPPDFTTEELIRAIDDLYALGMRWLCLLGGEPLLRDDIGTLIAHSKKKGMLVELVTNGYMVPKKIEELVGLDMICLSVEGDEETHDRARARAGSYRAIIDALEALKGRGPKIRLHATLLRSTLGAVEHLSALATRYGAEFGYSQVIVHDYNDSEEVKFSDDELRDFWKKLRDMKAAGHPCYNSEATLDYISSWPAPYRQIMTGEADESKFPGFDFIKCRYGSRYCYIDSEGFMYPCIVKGIKSGPNIRELGVAEAWRRLGDTPCSSCSYIQHVEVNSILNLRLKSIVKGAEYIFRRR